MPHFVWSLGLLLALTWVGKGNTYRIGIAMSDVTGPPVEITFMGYGKMEQKGSGIHLRQFSRAFIIQDGDRRLVFVSVDCSMMAHGVKTEVISRLQPKFGDTYTIENMMISATHTHSTPGGFLQHMLFDLSTLGFVEQTFEALVSGIVTSLEKAHDRMTEGKIFVTEGELLDANINRSPTSYEENPAKERARYEHNVDKTMTQLKFLDSNNRPLGVINWFAVHPTSMNNTNTLVSSDNVGYASVLFESKMNPNDLIGKGSFVAAFASSNLGDVSPNTRGPRCRSTGEMCDLLTSKCPGTEACIASGPGNNMFESTSIIAHKLMEKAWELWEDSNAKEVNGPIKVAHQFVDMPNATAMYKDPKTGTTSTVSRWKDYVVPADHCMPKNTVHGCLPAMGYSFGAGTTDGPGAFSFAQGTRTPNALWNALRDFIGKPTQEDIECQGAKPILIATGQMDFPFEWQPRVVPTQLAVIGNLALAAVPGEFTTMAGRRLRSSIAGTLNKFGAPANMRVIVAGLVNMYTDYIVTPEEYQVQRYEAASTIYGPHTLTLYLDQYSMLAEAIMKDVSPEAGPEPPELMNDLISLTTPVLYDIPSWQQDFGDCIEQPKEHVRAGQTVRAKFVAANPRNNLMHNGTFLTVERRNEKDKWQIVATDANWETKFRWRRTSTMLGNSEVLITWTVPSTALPGDYRIRHFGHYKYIFGGIFPYRGSSKVFKVDSASPNKGRTARTRFRHRDK